MAQTMKEILLKSPDDAEKVAREILALTEGKKVYTLNGQMGAGKTTLIKGFCKALGVMDKTSSPTFSVINEYNTSTAEKIYHFDCYRLKSPMEALDLGCEEYFYSGNYCFIEWPELLGDLVPIDAVKLQLDIKGHERSIRID
jgi:tRNA threonylcarbamoyladenosine biosynthesis protein TsaE